ncbi:MAG: exonuclease SbcCD subunit D [Bacteroidales bacterium]|nr:exonuclease SbcCD subunit D [Bacteroidales bacterium]
MKILHTSDWHLGHTLYGYDRTEEQQAMLNQMVAIVEKYQPDVFLLCGDIYHTSQPSAAVQRMLTEGMVRLHEAHPQMTIVMTAGNHDSGSKHEIFKTPWQALKVYAIGQLEKDNPDGHIVEIPGKGYIVAIPYVNERNLPDGIFQQLLDNVAERNSNGLPVVMTAHTTVRGCDFKGHEQATEYTVGGIDSADLSQMGDGYDYLALGHIHHEQFIHSGKHNVRYCGTPIPVSFDENFNHSVSLVTVESHGASPKVEIIDIVNPRPLVTLPTEGFASWDEAKRLLMEFPDDIPAYIRLNVEIDDFLPVEATEEAAKLTNGKQCRFCNINAKRKNAGESEAKVLTVQEFQSEEPIEIAKRYAEYIGVNFDEELTAMFNEAIKMVDDDSRNNR